jgi:hypothetical protein
LPPLLAGETAILGFASVCCLQKYTHNLRNLTSSLLCVIVLSVAVVGKDNQLGERCFAAIINFIFL